MASKTQDAPVIPVAYVDEPRQRLYTLSLVVLCQAIKALDFVYYLFFGTTNSYLRKWVAFDVLVVLGIRFLRIPRLKYSASVVILQLLSVCLLDGVLFGGISLNVGRGAAGDLEPSVRTESGIWGMVPGLGLSKSLYMPKDAHLLGQHTVRMSPVSTGRLNPQHQLFCLAPSGSVLIPILLNNTDARGLTYILTPLGQIEDTTSKVETVELSARDLKAIEQARVEGLQITRPAAAAQREAEEYDEYDDDPEADASQDPQAAHSGLQKTQSMIFIRLTKPGTVKLEKIVDASSAQVRLSFPSTITVVPCPQVEFVETPATYGQDVRCAGQDTNLDLVIDIKGVPPLSLRWFKEINGRREPFLVEGIEGDNAHPSNGAPQELKVPLSVTLDAVGTHLYVLEEITDAAGNNVRVHSESPTAILEHRRKMLTEGAKTAHSKHTRSMFVLRRPTVSFKHCSAGNPANLLIGSQANLFITTNDANVLDAPWDVAVKYEPPSDDNRAQAWNKSLKTPTGQRDLRLQVSSPGEYTILRVKGKWCEGDVLSPESCKVVEKPLPSAQIEWKRIHECSGDTGVSANLVLHGTPPFQVYYSTKLDNNPSKDTSRTFQHSRGELTLQPEHSGHYTYAFLRMSDANYKNVKLDGPTIDQVVHPLASADFSPSGSAGRSKKMINSCSGGMVNVDVELRGTGPWTLEVQVTSPKGFKTIKVDGITSARKTLQLPIPAEVDKEGGSFDIDLVSVEDAYECKRSISVPGISVNVRRVQPTVRFYGKDRQITVLENETARLPLRLTGDAPWEVKYRDSQGNTQTVRLSTPNDELQVQQKGLYEILEVSDSQCPGSVIPQETTYQVDWIPRPSARLSARTNAQYEAYNGSHILQPICEGLEDHVDLDLTGRPPFQLMYNVARNSDGGATKVLDQPTFSSIQPRTRFQLHTTSPGRMYYEVTRLGDSAYPLTKHKALIPRLERLLFEQEVYARPSAKFRTRGRVPYCLNDAFTPRDTSSNDGVIVLEGKAPFHLKLSVTPLTSSQSHTEIIKLPSAIWKVDIPSLSFTSVGPHLVKIESVQDAFGCAQAVLDSRESVMWVDVAESAAIVPVDHRENYCVGDTAQFKLSGIPPWSIGYRMNGKAHTQEAKVSPFSIAQNHAGEFTIASIAHQHKMCKAAVTDLRFVVHALPSATVGAGDAFDENIHEGDQAKITFTLVGEPPFTFTYQRSEPSIKKGKPGQVLETHSVSGVTTNTYSIWSALEGTWTVTSVSDRYCRYPRD